ncbi:uncharacterized protein N7496_000237 [Penicillium cataractarum]|uniref:Uncharacterized protein n=1 Tax=Penicillium cataractarum TaxID=2100454 RepID=A0A9W9VTY2_9EURO|nr:uncharacterized protein N7496_000237 [Penicillium cataractarum]KAJ5389169.1 hypothetical protein N7496_000237 [Penicillium cataractarum]
MVPAKRKNSTTIPSQDGTFTATLSPSGKVTLKPIAKPTPPFGSGSVSETHPPSALSSSRNADLGPTPPGLARRGNTPQPPNAAPQNGLAQDTIPILQRRFTELEGGRVVRPPDGRSYGRSFLNTLCRGWKASEQWAKEHPLTMFLISVPLSAAGVGLSFKK